MAVDAKTVKELRERTGAPILDCREALSKTDCDMEKAIVYLREKGMAAAGKKSGRATNDGKVVAYIHPGDKLGVMVEINCETDFVAKSEDFVEFTKNIAMQIAAANPLYLNREDVPADVLEKERQIFRTQAQNSDKPDHVIEKIVDGRLGKFYAEACLLEQSYIKDDKLTVQDIIKSAIAKFGENISIGRFARFKLGETA